MGNSTMETAICDTLGDEFGGPIQKILNTTIQKTFYPNEPTIHTTEPFVWVKYPPDLEYKPINAHIYHLDERLFLLGKYHEPYERFALFEFSFTKNLWRIIDEIVESPSMIAGNSMCRYKNSVILCGGVRNSKTTSDVVIFHLDSFSWSYNAGINSPPPREHHKTVIVGDSLILFGGFYVKKRKKYFNDLWVMDLSNFEWKQIKYENMENIPSPRSNFCLIHSERDCKMFVLKIFLTQKLDFSLEVYLLKNTTQKRLPIQIFILFLYFHMNGRKLFLPMEYLHQQDLTQILFV
jgi:hypothetical protein